MVLLPKTTNERALAICKRIHDRCSEAFVKEVPVSLALGVATKNKPGEDLLEILKEAEDNMYKQKLAESRSVRSIVLNTFLKTLGEKSFETEAHTRRMQSLALKIGAKLELPETEITRLILLIMLHDIGKINISEEILTKKGPLTGEEWECIKRHPEIGYRITRATEEFAHVAEDVLSHHERWDGKGYPRGLKGKEIPLLARIAAIADAYEVMTNGRPYKEALSKSEALAELIRGAGSQFDPELVKIFISVLDE